MFSKLQNYISNNTGILIRLDDIAENMNWNLMEKSESLFDKYKIKPVLGVIPFNKDKELLTYPKKKDFWNKVRYWSDKGFEIAMHGYTHVYDSGDSKKKDYFGYGGRSEFYGHSLEKQTLRIQEGLKKFNDENIKVKCFFAPNHTYDKNTLLALKNSGINEVIDGYGLMPYIENDIKFIPQLFYKIYTLPFGIQSTQIHLNYWKDKDFDNFEKFIIRNLDKIITYKETVDKVNNSLIYKIINFSTKKMLQTKRFI